MTQPPTTANCLAAFPLTGLGFNGLTKPMIDGKIDLIGDVWGDSTLGWNGSEYTHFTTLQMYESGLQGGHKDSSGNGIAFIGYDCSHTRLCVAAYLNYDSIDNANCTVNEDDQESFVQIGKTKKLKESTNGATFAYVKYTGGVNSADRTIGK